MGSNNSILHSLKFPSRNFHSTPSESPVVGWVGLVTIVGNSWHALGLLAGWNGADAVMRNGGWIVMMVSLMLAMYVAAFSFVFCFSRRDWGFGVGFVLSAIGMAVVVADLFRIPGRII